MTSALLLLSILTVGQEADEKRVLAQVRTEARAFAKAFQDDDAAQLADLTFAPWAEKVGSRNRLLGTWRSRVASYRHQGLQVEAYDIDPPGGIVKSGKDWLSVVPTRLKFQSIEGSASLNSFLLAISRDQGKTWRFLEGADRSATKHLDKWLPELPKKWELPMSEKVRVAADAKRTIQASAAGNFKVVQPKDWEPAQAVDKNTRLLFEHGEDKIYFFVDDVDTPIDLMVRYFETNQQTGKARRFNAKKDMIVAGEKAKFLRFEDSNDQQILQYYVVIFNHHGMSYRIIGVRQGVDLKGFESDYFAVLARFAFLSERTNWLKLTQGVPTKSVLLGGLASFELDRPRWTEDTFDAPAEFRALDYAAFRYLPLDAWINVALYESQGTLAAELQEVATHYAARVQNPSQKAVSFTTSKGKWSGWDIRGMSLNQERNYLIAVTVNDGLAAWIVLETTRGREEDTRSDFEELLESFHLQAHSKPAAPLAFPIRRYEIDRGADPRVTALLKKATRLYPGVKTSEVFAFTTDGKQALLSTNGGYFLEDLATKKRDALPIKGVRPFNVVLSSDRRWIAWQVNDEITLYPMGFGFSRKYKANASIFGFGPGNKELLLITGNQRPRYDSGDYYRNDYRDGGGSVNVQYLTSKLERLNLDNTPRKPLFDWPLIRVMNFALSPDEKQLAVVTNRDYPRGQQFGGLLYVCKPDGSDLRLVNKEPAEYRTIAWSVDSKAIYALRRPLRGPANLGIGQFHDIERIAVDTGETLNLTRCGRINHVWTGGGDLFVEIRDGSLPITQQGIFRIAPDELVKSAMAAPVVKTKETGVLAQRVAERLDRALGKKPLVEYVPTEASLQHLAKEFAEVVQAETGVVLDRTPESLDRLRGLIDSLELASGKHRVNVLGVGAYYGETLKKVVGAKWHLKPMPFGRWAPVRMPAANSVAEVVLPFSDSYGWAMFTGRIIGSNDIRQRAGGQDWLLVYPPTDADAVLKATCGEYLQAKKQVDEGQVDGALKILGSELRKRPRNVNLAREIVALCRAIERPDLSTAYTKQAVEAGIEASDLLVEYADAVVKTDAAQAIVYYRKAAHQIYLPASTLIKLGRAYQQAGQLALGESCWRRAYNTASDPERNEIRRLMGMPEQRPFNDFSGAKDK